MAYVVNALVYESREDKGKYVAEGFEISQIAVETTREGAKKDLLKAISQAIIAGQNDQTLKMMNPEVSSKRCRRGLRRAKANNQKPDIRGDERLNLEIHFYGEEKGNARRN